MQKLSLSYMILIVVLGSVTITTVLADSYNITNYPYVINDTSNDKPFVITSLGNVGINNASPSSSLDVGGAVTVGPTVAIGSTQLSEMNFRQINKAAPTYAMDATARLNYYADSAGGYVRSLDIVSSSYNTPSQIKFFTSSDGATIAEKMRIDSSGNVGIGTTAPAQKLDVAGNIRLTGNIVSPNDICIGSC